MREDKVWLIIFHDKLHLVIIVCLTVSFTMIYFSQQAVVSNVINFAARQSVSSYADIIESFRTLYTKHVIQKLQNSQFVITHKHKGVVNAIPLPATMSIELSQSINRNNNGIKSYLYSPYPFPWRKKEGGLRDSFQRQAWEMFRVDPTGEFFTIEEINGSDVIRYARADVMREECLYCHNTHEDSPKKDWEVGDVRGVLEIRQSIDDTLFNAGQKIRDTNFFLFVAAFFALFGFADICINFHQKMTQKNKLEVELKMRNEDLEKAYEDLEQFSYRSSHDLKGPLSTIKGFALYIQKDIDDGHYVEARKNAIKVFDNAERLEALVVDLLDLARADISHNATEKIDLELMIEEIKEKYSALIVSNGVSVNYHIDLEGDFYSEKIRILQILENLVSNAIKYCNRDEKYRFVQIDVYHDKSYSYINIEDNGLGIPIAHRKDMFSPFKRFHVDQGDGSGLGLSLVKRHIDRLGGSINIKYGKEVGLTFRVRLKRREEDL